MTTRVFRYQDNGVLEKYPLLNDSTSIFELPKVCPNGVPSYTAERNGTSNGRPFVNNVSSTCAQFDSQYTDIYPRFVIMY
jgi:hypothetical protein